MSSVARPKAHLPADLCSLTHALLPKNKLQVIANLEALLAQAMSKAKALPGLEAKHRAALAELDGLRRGPLIELDVLRKGPLQELEALRRERASERTTLQVRAGHGGEGQGAVRVHVLEC